MTESIAFDAKAMPVLAKIGIAADVLAGDQGTDVTLLLASCPALLAGRCSFNGRPLQDRLPPDRYWTWGLYPGAWPCSAHLAAGHVRPRRLWSAKWWAVSLGHRSRAWANAPVLRYILVVEGDRRSEAGHDV